MAEHSGAWSSFSQQNGLAWEEIADVRTHRWSNRLYTAEFFAAGGCSLDQRVVDALGQLDAARVLHLMCSTGEDPVGLPPVASAFEADDDEVRLACDYFGGPGPTETRGWTHFAAGGDAQTPKYEFRWMLGEIVTALADAGLCVTALGEYPSEADWQFGNAIEAARCLPGQLLLVAQRL